MLIAGIVPGLLCVAMLMLMTGWLAVRAEFAFIRTEGGSPGCPACT